MDLLILGLSHTVRNLKPNPFPPGNISDDLMKVRRR